MFGRFFFLFRQAESPEAHRKYQCRHLRHYFLTPFGQQMPTMGPFYYKSQQIAKLQSPLCVQKKKKSAHTGGVPPTNTQKNKKTHVGEGGSSKAIFLFSSKQMRHHPKMLPHKKKIIDACRKSGGCWTFWLSVAFH